MSEKFYTILTSLGKAKIANSGVLGTKVNFVKFKVGDGGGTYYNPTEDQTDVKNKVWEGNISSIAVDENNPNWIVIETVIPTLVGGFTIREAGIFDDENNLIAIGKYPETYKPIAEQGSSKDLLIRMILEVSNAENVNLKVDPTIILATKKDIQVLESRLQEINTQLSDMDYQVAVGTATAITLTMQTLRNGYAKTFIASASNGGVATTINGKSLYKPSTTTSPNLIIGKAYTVWYNLTGNCFFIKASAEGNTIASHVLAGDTFSNDTDTGLVGTIPSKTSATYSPSTTAQTIASGQYLSGIQTISAITGTAGVADVLATKTFSSANGISLTGTMINRGAVVITPSTANQAIVVGYHNGSGYVLGDADLIAANIISGKSVFGVAGSASIASLGGLQYASGTIGSYSYASNSSFQVYNPSSYNYYFYMNLSNIPFTPKIFWTSGGSMANAETNSYMNRTLILSSSSYYTTSQAGKPAGWICVGFNNGNSDPSTIWCNWYAIG